MTLYTQTPPSINQSATDANTLFTALMAGITDSYVPPTWDIDSNFNVPAGPPMPEFPEIVPITVDQLTSGSTAGTGVIDRLMQMVTAHLEQQAEKGRITGADYAKVYLGSIQSAMEIGTNFLLEKDRRHWETLQAQAQMRVALATETRALADVETAKAGLLKARVEFELLHYQLLTQKNQYVTTKINLLTSYQGVVNATLQGNLVDRQVTMMATETILKENQAILILEQYESQRGQTRGTLSTGEAVGGMIGAQTALYNQQVTSYKRDGENKALKLMLDTWIARKTIDEGVAVPAGIDTPAINTAMSVYTTNLQL